MTTSPEALREAVERLTAHAEFIGQPDTGVVMVAFPRHVVAADLRTLLSALQEAREALRLARDFAEQEIECRGYAGGEMTDYQDEAQKAFDACDAMLSAIEARALSPGGAEQ